MRVATSEGNVVVCEVKDVAIAVASSEESVVLDGSAVDNGCESAWIATGGGSASVDGVYSVGTGTTAGGSTSSAGIEGGGCDGDSGITGRTGGIGMTGMAGGASVGTGAGAGNGRSVTMAGNCEVGSKCV